MLFRLDGIVPAGLERQDPPLGIDLGRCQRFHARHPLSLVQEHTQVYLFFDGQTRMAQAKPVAIVKPRLIAIALEHPLRQIGAQRTNQLRLQLAEGVGGQQQHPLVFQLEPARLFPKTRQNPIVQQRSDALAQGRKRMRNRHGVSTVSINRNES